MDSVTLFLGWKRTTVEPARHCPGDRKETVITQLKMPHNCLRKGDDGRAWDSCIGAGDDNSPAERQLYRRDCTQCSARNSSPAASSCRHRVTRYLPHIAGAASPSASIKKLLLLQHNSSSSIITRQQQGGYTFITPILASIL